MIVVEDIQELHREAMDLAEMAFIAKLKGDPEGAENLLREAYKKESDSAKLLVDEYDFEPTRSILYRSAASLAIECNDVRGAERLIAFGLAGNPPEEIAEELRDLLERVNLQRHLNLQENFERQEEQAREHSRNTTEVNRRSGAGLLILHKPYERKEASFAPYVSVSISSSMDREPADITFKARLDTGADITLSPRIYASKLELPLNNRITIRGNGNISRVRTYRMAIYILGYPDKSLVRYIPKTGVLLTDSDTGVIGMDIISRCKKIILDSVSFSMECFERAFRSI